MKKRKNEIVMFFIVVVIIGINQIVFSKYESNYKFEGSSSVAKAIIEIEGNDTIDSEINQMSFPMEYDFCINNFDDKNNINEIDFEYIISLENSVEKFPVKYTLYDCDNEKELKLKDGKSEKIKIAKNKKESRNFKIIMYWREIEDELDSSIDIKLKVNAVQEKEVE